MRIFTKIILLSFLLCALVVQSSIATAANGDPKYIPYQGTLQRDGQAVNGHKKMGFRLYDSPSATTAHWSEDLDVDFYEGRFSVILGSSSAQSVSDLTQVINSLDKIYLEVVIDPDGEATVLNGRQRFLPVPFAIWTTAATNFNVSQKLSVQGGAEINGPDNDGSQASLTIKDTGSSKKMLIDSNEIDSTGARLYLNRNVQNEVQTGGDLKSGGNFSVVGTDIVFAANSRGTGGRALVHGNDDTLILNFSDDFSGHTKVDSELYVNGSLHTSQSGCRADNCSSWHDVSGGHDWGYWRGRTYCPAHEFVCGIEQKVEGSQGDGDDTSVNDIAIICCPL